MASFRAFSGAMMSRRRADDGDDEKRVEFASAEHLKQLSHTFLRSIKNYTRGNPKFYEKLNKELRAFTSARRKRICAWSVALQEVFFHKKCPRVGKGGIIVYRGVANDLLQQRLESMKKGDVFEEEGFMSTTFATHVAERFRDRQGPRGCCVMIIALPPGTPVLALETVTAVQGESEVLLPPGMGLELHRTTTLNGKKAFLFGCRYCTYDTRFHVNAALGQHLRRRIRVCFD